ncbi:MAG: ribonuclease III [Mycoplasmoidaceae bacterium]
MQKKIKSLMNQFNLKDQSYPIFLQAFTHSTYKNENHISFDYERLELLGDSVIQLFVTEFLFEENNSWNESKLTEERKKIVSGSTLSLISNELKLIDCCFFGKGIDKIKDVSKIEQDIYESFIAAVYLSHGWQKCKKIIDKTLLKYYKTHDFINKVFDYKTTIQEILQKKNSDYKVNKNSKIIYKQIKNNKSINNYKVSLIFNNHIYGVGTGSKVTEAEQNAAKNAYEKLIK